MICKACGTQYPPHQPLPALCPICTDDRQYVPANGQQWVTTAPGYIHREQLDKHIYSFKIQPNFAIANRALLITSPGGNILWDCIPLLYPSTIEFIRNAGGLKAIAFSHPHFYSLMNDWAAVFNCPIYIHEKDEQWIQYKGPHVQLWEGDQYELWDDFKIIHTGGHFPGSCILQQGEETVFIGDTFYIAPSMKHMSVMYSYPNQILLPRDTFAAVERRMEGVHFHTAYGAFDHQNLKDNAMDVYNSSMQRYRESYGLEKQELVTSSK